LDLTPTDVSAGLAWPAALKDIVPQPIGNAVKGVLRLSELDWRIRWSGPGSAQMSAYVQQLLSAGYSKLSESTAPDGSLAEAHLQKSTVRLDLFLGAESELTMTVIVAPK
jgi:hypothetical protein